MLKIAIATAVILSTVPAFGQDVFSPVQTVCASGQCSAQSARRGRFRVVQRTGNDVYITVGLINVLQGVTDSTGVNQTSSISRSRNRSSNRRRIFRRR